MKTIVQPTISVAKVGKRWACAAWLSSRPNFMPFVAPDFFEGALGSAAAAREAALEAVRAARGRLGALELEASYALAADRHARGLDPYPRQPDPPRAPASSSVDWDRERACLEAMLRGREGDFRAAEIAARARVAAEAREAARQAADREWRERVARAVADAVREVFGGAAQQAQGMPRAINGVPDLSPLGLTWPCTADDVRRAYRATALRVHPDRGGSHEAMVGANRARAAALRALGEA